MAWPSPAKLNLFLHVLGQREDGYHTLQTVFQFLDYGDTLHFEQNDGDDIKLATTIPGVAAQDNLILRAATLLKPLAQSNTGVTITLDKQLPIGAGLGGGSSNAATTLVALNQLWDCQCSTQQLITFGCQLGADVPIFIQGVSAWAEGIGDKLTPLLALDEPWYCVVFPNCTVSTAAIFSSPYLTRDCKPITISRFISGEGSNSLTDCVSRHYPEVSAALNWLDQYGEAKMTGTGSCVFVRCETAQQAQLILAELPREWRGFVAKGCNTSPLATYQATQWSTA